MKYHLNIYTNIYILYKINELGSSMQNYASVKLHLLFLILLIDRKLLYVSSLYCSRLVWYFNLILEVT